MIFRNTVVPGDVLGIKQDFYELPRMIRLSKAVLCLNCDMVFARKENKIGTANNYCPNCASKNTRFISKFLNRKEDDKH